MAVLDERKRKTDRAGGGVPVEVAVAVAVVSVLEGLVGVLTEPSVPAAHYVLHQAMAQTLRHYAHGDGVGRETHRIDP